MKKTLNYLVPILIMAGLIYLGGCFLGLTIDPNKMEINLRKWLVLFWLVMSAMFSLCKWLGADEEKEKEY